jgi:hypothetical protein
MGIAVFAPPCTSRKFIHIVIKSQGCGSGSVRIQIQWLDPDPEIAFKKGKGKISLEILFLTSFFLSY